MNLPAWVGKPPKHAPRPEYRVADSIHTASGWRVLGEDFYTCVPPVDQPVDPAIQAWVKSFAPDLIFFWRKQRVLPPGKNVPILVTHNCVGRHSRRPDRDLVVFDVEMPLGASHLPPNEILFCWEEFDKTYWFEGGPGGYMPWTGELVRFLESARPTLRHPRRIVQERSARDQARKQAKLNFYRDQYQYIWNDINRWIANQLDKPGDTMAAWREYRRKARALGKRVTHGSV